MIALQKAMCALPALHPMYGGEGEVKKAAYLKQFAAGLSPDELSEVHAPDPRVPSGTRPTVVCRWKGAESSRTLWLLTHTDVVPPGEISLWKRSPWEAWLEDGRLYGRGVEDNQQSLTASLFALKACREESVRFPVDVGLMFMADEETGSELGMRYVLENTTYFRPDDLFVVPDGGSADGADIEIAEKGGAWIKISTHGKQCHASMPELGVNAFRAGSALAASLEALYAEFPRKNPLYSPETSTFEPTKKEANVPNINTIPGEDVFYMDCRILPEEPVDTVLAAIRRHADAVEKRFGVKVDIEPAGKMTEAAPATSPGAPVVKLYSEAVRQVYKLEPRLVGIGGGTVGAFLRRRGYPVVVTGKNQFMAHQPNEFCVIDNMVGDAKVFAHLMGSAS